MEVTTLRNQHSGHEFYLLVSWFVLTLWKLLEEVVKEIHFLTIVAKADTTIQYWIIWEKFNIRVIWQDLYNIINKFRCEVMSGKADTGILLKRLYDKKWKIHIE